MRLGAKRRIYIRSNRVNKRKVSAFLLFLLFVLLVTTGFVYFLKLVKPLILEMSKNQATVIAEQAIHRAANQVFRDCDYTHFIQLSRLDDGTVSAIESNMAEVNRLKAEAAIAIQEGLSSIKASTVRIPLGSLTGITIFSGLGARLPVDLMPYGRVVVDFESRFSEAGINQTHFEITLHVTSHVHIVMPTGQTNACVETELPVVQTVLVGKVPDNYVNIDRMGEEYEDDVLDIIG